jgi:DNA-binding beta-propeller fold protein YncE
MWPPVQDAETPRFVYLGELTGEANFRKPGATEGGGGFMRWLIALVAGEREPVVLQRPQSGAIDATGRILVSDSSRQAVFVFDTQQGSLELWQNAAGLTRFKAPAGIAVGAAGEVYVADAELGMVARFDRAGKSLGAIGKGELRRPVGLAFDIMKNELYVADTYAHEIKVFDGTGALLRTLGRRGESPGNFNYPTYLALNQDELYVVDTMSAQVQVVDSETGQPLRVIGRRGLNVGDLVRPKGVALDGDGNVYVVESYYDHLLIFSQDGEFLLPIGGTGKRAGQFYLPAGVWTDDRDRIYVADMFNGRVSVFQFLGGKDDAE